MVDQISLPERNLSAISYLELLYGCRDRDELKLLKNSLTEQFAEIIPVSETVSASALALMEQYVLARRPDLTDILIAATAIARSEVLITANRKHFEFIPGLALQIFRP